jgi:hypothetical protein
MSTAALEQTTAPAGATRAFETVWAPIAQLREHPQNPRKHFDQAKLDELAQSLREKGVLNWRGHNSFPKTAKAFGIDVTKILDEVAPVEKPAAVAMVKDGDKPKPSKKARKK